MKETHQKRSSLEFTAYTPEETLALIVDTNLGKEQYVHIQQEAKKRGATIYPPYNDIASAKKKCYIQKKQKSDKRKSPKKVRKLFPPEVIKFLEIPEYLQNEVEATLSDTEEDISNQ
ncbi:hypothetical protein ILUMI_21477 [Ignelater luminosus]|uniref:Uncharacterized protein n=1 Tax=Ignelater luminosus TaxID=2038154 RepID=A0A8K0CIT4_IGNLU|nr:hypothetical protein ILUMI_21477 [Ignelater luminosus]